MQIENIIIGGGLAGLLCAWRFEKQGLPYLLLEAKDQLGGRIMGVKDPQSDHYHDLGPTWVFPHQHHIQQLLDELYIPYFEQYAKGDAIFEKSDNQGLTKTQGAGAMLMYRVEGGMTTLINVLSSKLNNNNLKTGFAVNQLSMKDGIWTIEARSAIEPVTIQAKKLILALPPRMITKHLTPQHWASNSLTNALQKVPTWMAAQAKYVAVYDSAFWREQGLSGEVFSQQGPMQEMHDACSAENLMGAANNSHSHALFGFLGIPANYRVKYEESQITQACSNQLGKVYGALGTEIKLALYKDWATDEFVASEHDINNPPNHPDFSITSHEKELTEKNIYLTGSEFSQVDAGYLEGAVCAVNDAFIKMENT